MNKDIFSVKNSVVVITGGAGGIGKCLAQAFSKGEAFVYSLDISYISKSPKFGPNLCKIKADVTDEKEFKRICEGIFGHHGKIDTLINCAGITRPKKNNKEMYSLKDWDDTLRLNLTAAFACSQAAIEYMLKNKKGSIINITSLNAERGFPGNPAYIASKGGLKMLTKSLARDWGIYGIRVNNIGPGYMKTDMTKKSYNVKKTRLLRQANTMLNKWGTPEDLIGPCIFLASDASNYITGLDLYVDGGWMANGLPLDL